MTQTFDPLDFLARMLMHVPAPRLHTTLFYGWSPIIREVVGASSRAMNLLELEMQAHRKTFQMPPNAAVSEGSGQR